MPQMSPLNWLSLFIIFSITFIIFNSLNYFIFNPPMFSKKKMLKSTTNSLTWKW